MARTCIFQPPSFFRVLFGLIKVFMSKKQLAKMSVCPGRSAARQSAAVCPFASARFDLDKLPSFLGGTCQCAARGGCIGCTPNQQQTLATVQRDGLRTLAVPSGGRAQVALAARAAGDKLMYEFEIAAGGLEVSATLAPETGPTIELLPLQKFRAEDGKVSGSVLLPACGGVTMLFNNSHSRFKSKSVVANVFIVDHGLVTAAAAAEKDTPAQLEAVFEKVLAFSDPDSVRKEEAPAAKPDEAEAMQTPAEVPAEQEASAAAEAPTAKPDEAPAVPAEAEKETPAAEMPAEQETALATA